MRRKRNRPEQKLQITIVNALRQILTPRTFFCHIPNGGYRTSAEAGIFKAMGVRAGCPDLLFIHEGQAFLMELKADDGALTENQRACHLALKSAGAHVEVVRSLDEALECLAIWNIPTRLKSLPSSAEGSLEDRAGARGGVG